VSTAGDAQRARSGTPRDGRTAAADATRTCSAARPITGRAGRAAAPLCAWLAVWAVAWAAAMTGTAAAQDARAARVDAVFAELAAAHAPGAAVAVVQDGRIVLERGYGSAQLEHDVPITPATVFHVASVSKQFTAFAVAQLAQQGRLSLDDDIRTHLPELHDFGHRITIRHLVHHTSGVRDQWELLMMAGWRLDDVITRDQIMAMMRRQRELNFEPGAEYLYSNMGYTLLAEIVERVTGGSFGAYLRANVFDPLGMSATHVHSDHEMIVPNRAYSYRPVEGGGGWRNAVLSYANQGATSLFTTAGDLGRWLVNFETARVGGPQLIAQMRERGVLNSGDTITYAFAISRGRHRGRTTWGHSGADAGFRSYAVHFPDERLGVVVLSNAANANPGRLALAVADIYLGETGPLAQQVAGPPAPSRPQPPARGWQPAAAQLGGFTGDFYSPELATIYSVELRDDVLVLASTRIADTRLTPGDAEDTFRAGNRVLRFQRDDAGAVTGMRLTGSRVRNIAFLRLPAGALPRLHQR
jgi:CubicO group peptidase (beta-lactamase class C family)